MSNNIQNRLKIVGTEKEIEEVLNSIKGEKEIIDFDKIIPMPKELDIKSGSDSDTGLSVIKQRLGVNINPIEKYYVDQFDNLDEESKDRILKVGFSCVHNIVKYGYPTWFEWRKANWGTKWNAYYTELKNGNEIWFTTAWQNVNDKIIRKLSSAFPDVLFEYSFSSEDTANNCGKSKIQNGEGVLTWIENGSEKALELYKELHPQYADDYEWIDGGIICKDEE